MTFNLTCLESAWCCVFSAIESLAIPSESITIDSPISTGEDFEKAANAFLSACTEGATKYNHTNSFHKRIGDASKKAGDAIGDSPTTERNVSATIGPFKGYTTSGFVETGLDGHMLALLD